MQNDIAIFAVTLHRKKRENGKKTLRKVKNARLLVAEYFRQLSTQERIVRRIVDEKWNEAMAGIELMVERKIEEKMRKKARSEEHTSELQSPQ